jgi:hypothetical protein
MCRFEITSFFTVVPDAASGGGLLSCADAADAARAMQKAVSNRKIIEAPERGLE